MAFDSIVNTGNEDGGAVDLGALAESLLFYQSVQLLTKPAQLKDLIGRLGGEQVVALMDRGALHVRYQRRLTGCRTHRDGLIEFHEPVTIEAEKHDLDQFLWNTLKPNHPRQRRLHRQLMDRIGVDRVDEGTIRDAKERVSDATWMCQAVQRLLPEYLVPPSTIASLRFVPTWGHRGFTVDTNIDVAAVNGSRPQHLPEFTVARVIATVTSACVELRASATSRADLCTQPHTAAIVATMAERISQQTVRSSEQLRAFQEITLGSGHAVAEAVNSGTRGIADVIRLLDQADRFREWLSLRAPDAELMHAYYSAMSRDSWITSLPAKTFRWLATTAGGAAIAGTPGLLAGAALSAFDTFVVDALGTGWRPNQFVNGALRAFSSVSG